MIDGPILKKALERVSTTASPEDVGVKFDDLQQITGELHENPLNFMGMSAEQGLQWGIAVGAEAARIEAADK